MILQTAKRLYFSSIFEVSVVGEGCENHRNKKYNPRTGESRCTIEKRSIKLIAPTVTYFLEYKMFQETFGLWEEGGVKRLNCRGRGVNKNRTE